MPVNEKVTLYKVYSEHGDLLGSAKVTLPDIEYLSDTMTGAGIAGEIDSPTIGQFAAMTTKIGWKVPEKKAGDLLAPGLHSIEVRANIQQFDERTGGYKNVPLRAYMKVRCKKLTGGEVDNNKPLEAEQEFSVVYYKHLVDYRELWEIDVLNAVCRFNGVDYLAEAKRNVGM